MMEVYAAALSYADDQMRRILDAMQEKRVTQAKIEIFITAQLAGFTVLPSSLGSSFA